MKSHKHRHQSPCNRSHWKHCQCCNTDPHSIIVRGCSHIGLVTSRTMPIMTSMDADSVVSSRTFLCFGTCCQPWSSKTSIKDISVEHLECGLSRCSFGREGFQKTCQPLLYTHGITHSAFQQNGLNPFRVPLHVSLCETWLVPSQSKHVKECAPKGPPIGCKGDDGLSGEWKNKRVMCL